MSNRYTYVDSSNYNPVAGWIVGCQISKYVDSSIHMLILVTMLVTNPVAGWIVGCQRYT